MTPAAIPALQDELNFYTTYEAEYYAAAERAAQERQEIAAAHVARHRDEQLLVTRIIAGCLMVAKYTPDGTFTADVGGLECDAAGIPRHGVEAQRIRRRVISAAINQGRREGKWRAVGYTKGRARRPVTVWLVV